MLPKKLAENVAQNLGGGVFGPECGILDALERLMSDGLGRFLWILTM
jgi:hypothetical protein